MFPSECPLVLLVSIGGKRSRVFEGEGNKVMGVGLCEHTAQERSRAFWAGFPILCFEILVTLRGGSLKFMSGCVPYILVAILVCICIQYTFNLFSLTLTDRNLRTSKLQAYIQLQFVPLNDHTSFTLG